MGKPTIMSTPQASMSATIWSASKLACPRLALGLEPRWVWSSETKYSFPSRSTSTVLSLPPHCYRRRIEIPQYLIAVGHGTVRDPARQPRLTVGETPWLERPEPELR